MIFIVRTPRSREVRSLVLDTQLESGRVRIQSHSYPAIETAQPPTSLCGVCLSSAVSQGVPFSRLAKQTWTEWVGSWLIISPTLPGLREFVWPNPSMGEAALKAQEGR